MSENNTQRAESLNLSKRMLSSPQTKEKLNSQVHFDLPEESLRTIKKELEKEFSKIDPSVINSINSGMDLDRFLNENKNKKLEEIIEKCSDKMIDVGEIFEQIKKDTKTNNHLEEDNLTLLREQIGESNELLDKNKKHPQGYGAYNSQEFKKPRLKILSSKNSLNIS